MCSKSPRELEMTIKMKDRKEMRREIERNQGKNSVTWLTLRTGRFKRIISLQMFTVKFDLIRTQWIVFD